MLDKIRSRRKPATKLCNLSLENNDSDKVSAIGKLAFAEGYPEIAETLLNEREVDPDNNDMPSVAAPQQEESKEGSADASAAAGTESNTTQSETSSAAADKRSGSKISEEAMAKKIMDGAAASSSNTQTAIVADESAEGLEDMLEELI